MKQRLLFLVLCGWLAAPALAAHSSTNVALSSNRFLFIVDSSSSMKPLAEATRELLFDLIFTGVDGQMKPGDTFGLWVFDQATLTDFPMQAWNPRTSFSAAMRVSVYLADQRHNKPSNVEQVLRKAVSVVRSVKDVTVLIFSDGSNFIQGTPFDEQINQTYRHETRLIRPAALPFVTVLAARKGRIEDWRVSEPGQAVELPRPIPALQVSEATRTEPVAPVKTNVPPSSTLAEKTPTAPAPAESITPAPSLGATTNARETQFAAEKPKDVEEIKSVAKPPAESAPPKQTPVAEVKTNTIPALIVAVAMTNPPAESIETKPGPATVPAKAEELTARPPAPGLAISGKPVEVTERTREVPPLTIAQAEINLPPTVPAVEIARTELAPSVPALPPALVHPEPSLPPAIDTAPLSIKAAIGKKSESIPKPEPALHSVSATKIGPAKIPKLAVVTPENEFSSTTRLVAGLALLVVAGLLGWFLLRRARGGPQSSLISESMNPHSK